MNKAKSVIFSFMLVSDTWSQVVHEARVQFWGKFCLILSSMSNFFSWGVYLKAWQFNFIWLQNCSTYSYFQRKDSSFFREISGKWKCMLEVLCTHTRYYIGGQTANSRGRWGKGSAHQRPYRHVSLFLESDDFAKQAWLDRLKLFFGKLGRSKKLKKSEKFNKCLPLTVFKIQLFQFFF